MARPETIDPALLQNARDAIAEAAGGLMAHASVIRTFAEFGNDPGLVYAAKCTAAYLRAMLAGIEELDRCRALAMSRRNAGNLGPGQGFPNGGADA